jgi:hypothetical protein
VSDVDPSVLAMLRSAFGTRLFVSVAESFSRFVSLSVVDTVTVFVAVPRADGSTITE